MHLVIYVCVCVCVIVWILTSCLRLDIQTADHNIAVHLLKGHFNSQILNFTYVHLKANSDIMSAKTKATRSFTERIPVPLTQNIQTDFKVVTVNCTQTYRNKIRRWVVNTVMLVMSESDTGTVWTYGLQFHEKGLSLYREHTAVKRWNYWRVKYPSNPAV